jgi:uncharacterized protein YkwD
MKTLPVFSRILVFATCWAAGSKSKFRRHRPDHSKMFNDPGISSSIGMLPAVLIICSVLATACSPVAWRSEGLSEETVAERKAFSPRPRIDPGELEQRIHELVNQERVRLGLSPLVWNPILNKVARLHSQDMARRGYFGHNSPEGHDLSYRYAHQGFVCEVAAGTMIYEGSENIYQAGLYHSIDFVNDIPVTYNWNDLEKIARAAVKGWMSSPTHRRSMIEPSWKTQGIGVAISNDYKVYITQDFC